MLVMVDGRRGELVISGDLNGLGCFPTKNLGGGAVARAAGTGVSGTGVENNLDAEVNVGLGGDTTRLGRDGVGSFAPSCWLAEMVSSSSFHSFIFALALKKAVADGISRPSEERDATDIPPTLPPLGSAVAAVLNPTKAVGTLDSNQEEQSMSGGASSPWSFESPHSTAGAWPIKEAFMNKGPAGMSCGGSTLLLEHSPTLNANGLSSSSELAQG